jgi:prevent-host-death family protein
MPKTVSATEAKNRLGALVAWAVEHRDEVIVEAHGKPHAVIMSYADYEAVQALREQARRREALERLRALRARVSARNQDLTEEQAMAFADQMTREAIDSLVRQGKVRFASDAGGET